MDVVVIGELNPDLIFTGLDRPPTLGVEQLADGFELTLGSSSAIFAVALARLGPRVGMFARVGDDEFGRFCVAFLREQGVDTSHIIIDSRLKTGVTVSLSYPQDRLLVTYQGAMASLKASDLDWDYIKKARHLHVSSFYLQEGLRPDLAAVYQKAKTLGLSTSLDTGWDPKERWERDIERLWGAVDVFLPNEGEALKISGAEAVEGADGALARLSRVVPTVAIKLGAKGAVAAQGTRRVQRNGLSVPVVDTTGAGDSFNAGFVYAYLNGMDLEEALTWGNACGALSASKAGGTSGYGSIQEVRRFLKEQGIKGESIEAKVRR